MKIEIDFEQAYFNENMILAMVPKDLDDFYVTANDVDQMNLFLF